MLEKNSTVGKGNDSIDIEDANKRVTKVKR